MRALNTFYEPYTHCLTARGGAIAACGATAIAYIPPKPVLMAGPEGARFMSAATLAEDDAGNDAVILVGHTAEYRPLVVLWRVGPNTNNTRVIIDPPLPPMTTTGNIMCENRVPLIRVIADMDDHTVATNDQMGGIVLYRAQGTKSADTPMSLTPVAALTNAALLDVQGEHVLMTDMLNQHQLTIHQATIPETKILSHMPPWGRVRGAALVNRDSTSTSVIVHFADGVIVMNVNGTTDRYIPLDVGGRVLSMTHAKRNKILAAVVQGMSGCQIRVWCGLALIQCMDVRTDLMPISRLRLNAEGSTISATVRNRIYLWSTACWDTS